MLYDLILASGARFQVEFDEDPVGPKNITAKASFFAATELQKHLQQSVELQDQLGLSPWEPVEVVVTKPDPLHMNSHEARTSAVVLKLG